MGTTAGHLAQQVQSQFDQANRLTRSTPEADRPRAMVVSSRGAGSTGNVTAAGRATAAHQIVTSTGAVNTGAEAGLQNYQSVTAEGVAAARPEVIVVAESELADMGGRDGIWTKVPGLAATPAGQQKALIVLPDMQHKGAGVSSGVGTLSPHDALYPAP